MNPGSLPRAAALILFLLSSAWLRADSDQFRISKIEIESPEKADRILNLSYDSEGRLTLLEDSTRENAYSRWEFFYNNGLRPYKVDIEEEGEWD